MEADATSHRLAHEPWRFGFFAAVRWIETRHRHLPRVGAASRPSDEPLRLGQPPALGFAPATLHAAQPGAGGRPWRVQACFFGLWGPQGPMPLHLTERVHERTRRQPPDHAAAAFADVFHHRLSCLLYRAWAEAEPAVGADRRRASGAHQADDAFHQRAAALHVPGRSRAAIAATLAQGLRCRVRVRASPPRWWPVPTADRCRLGRPLPCSRLGAGAVLGGRVLAAGHALRIDVGPVPPTLWWGWTGPRSHALRERVRQAVPAHLAFDLRVLLPPGRAPPPRLGAGDATSATAAIAGLGQGLWLGGADPLKAADDRGWRCP